MGTVTTVGIDLAKSVFHLHGVDERGRVVFKKKLSRAKFAQFVANLQPCLVGMEACGGAHYWARKLIAAGHDVRLMNPKFVVPYVKTNKNDYTDAEAICEAVSRPNMRYVAVKTEEQQAVLAVHRCRQRAVKTRTALANQARGLLLEYGIAIPKGMAALRRALVELRESDELSDLVRELLDEWWQQLQHADEEIKRHEKRLRRFLRSNEDAKRLETIPGVGLLSATALVATIGDPRVFRNGRHLAAYLGLVPKQRTTGGKPQLLGISKRGDKYVRGLLTHGGRSVLAQCERQRQKHQIRAKALKDRKHVNVATVAIANKNARIAWALLTKKEDYKAA